MTTKRAFRIIYTGLLAGVVSEAILGGLFMSGPVQSILYNPEWQSELFIAVKPATPDLIKAILGLIVLSIAHSWFYEIFKPAIPGNNWLSKGLGVSGMVCLSRHLTGATFT